MYNSSSSSLTSVLGTSTVAGTIVLANTGVSYIQFAVILILLSLIAIFGYLSIKSFV